MQPTVTPKQRQAARHEIIQQIEQSNPSVSSSVAQCLLHEHFGLGLTPLSFPAHLDKESPCFPFLDTQDEK